MKEVAKELQFTVTLHHLASGAREAGTDFPDLEVSGVGSSELRELLENFARLAHSVEYPVTPEVRIGSPHGQFLVQIRDGHIRFSSWALRDGIIEPTPDQILAAISGLEGGDEQVTTLSAPAMLKALAPARRSKWAVVALLAAAIIGTNSVTVWLLTRPAPSLLPEYELVEGAPGSRLLAEVAGDFETGHADGDRRMSIRLDGAIRWVMFGPAGELTEDTALTAQPAKSGGKPVLLTSEQALIEIQDPMTIVYYGDTYRRIHGVAGAAADVRLGR